MSTAQHSLSHIAPPSRHDPQLVHAPLEPLDRGHFPNNQPVPHPGHHVCHHVCPHALFFCRASISTCAMKHEPLFSYASKINDYLYFRMVYSHCSSKSTCAIRSSIVICTSFCIEMPRYAMNGASQLCLIFSFSYLPRCASQL